MTDQSCSIAITLRHVVTRVQISDPRVVFAEIPFPDGALFTVEAAATLLGVKCRTLWNELSEKRAHLQAPMYRLDAHKRRHRLLTPSDMDYLRHLFKVRIVVKRNHDLPVQTYPARS